LKLRLISIAALLLLLAGEAHAVIDSMLTSPAGTNGRVQFNKRGSFGSDFDFYYDTTTKILYVQNITCPGCSFSGGTASSLELFNTNDGTRSSPTASIGLSNAFRGTVSGSTYTFRLNFSSVASQSDLANYLSISSAIITYLQLSSATATYLTKSSATATYVNKLSSVTIAGRLVAGSNITLTPGAGITTIAASGGGSGVSVYPATSTVISQAGGIDAAGSTVTAAYVTASSSGTFGSGGIFSLGSLDLYNSLVGYNLDMSGFFNTFYMGPPSARVAKLQAIDGGTNSLFTLDVTTNSALGTQKRRWTFWGNEKGTDINDFLGNKSFNVYLGSSSQTGSFFATKGVNAATMTITGLTSQNCIGTDGSGNVQAGTCGSGGASALEVFSNFDATRTSPTASIATGDALKLSVSGSTAIITVDFSSVTSRSDALLDSSASVESKTLFVASGTLVNNMFFTDSDSPARIEFTHSALPRSGGIGPQTVDSTIFNRQFINSGSAGSFQIATSSYASISSSLEGMARITLAPPGTSTDASATVTARNTGTGGAGKQGDLIVNPSTITVSLEGASRAAVQISNTSGALILYDSDASNYAGFRSSSALSANQIWTLPPVDGSSTHFLQTNGAGSLYFGTTVSTITVSTLTVTSQMSFQNAGLITISSATLMSFGNDMAVVMSSATKFMLPHSATPISADCDADNERGRIYIDTDATSGRQLYVCEGLSGWVLQGDGNSGGGGGASSLEVFSNFDNTHSSPTASIATGDALKLTVSGSTAIINVDFSSVTALGQQIDLNSSAEVNGVLPVANGGTGASTLGLYGSLYGNGTSAIGVVTAGSAGLVLTSQLAGPPVWSTPTGGGGSSALAIGTGTASNFTNNVTSPTAALSFDGSQFHSTALGTTNYVTVYALPAATISAGALGSGVIASSVAINTVGRAQLSFSSMAFTTSYKAAICQGPNVSLGFSGLATSTPAATCVNTSSAVFGVASFTDISTMTVQDHFHLPSDWVGAIDAQVVWKSTQTTGNVVWQIRTSCVADGEVSNTSWNAASTVTDATKGTTNQFNTASITGITTTNCSADEELFFDFYRDPNHASDTLAATADLVTLQFTIRRTF
jgi:hypothetical protein